MFENIISSRFFKYIWKDRVNFIRSEACILILIASALFIRIYRLEQVPAGLFWDEISAVYNPYLYQMGLVDISIRSIIAYVLSGTFFTYSIFGPSVFFTRLPEVLFGTLLVFVVYLFAKEMFSKKVGLISALLLNLSPWALHFSRFQAFCSAYALYFTVAIFFLYKGINSSNRRSKFILYCLGSLLLGLSTNIISSSRVFIPLFIIGFLIACIRINHLKIFTYIPRMIACVSIFLFACSPVFIDYLIHDPITSRAFAYSTYSNSQDIFDLLGMVFERVYMHLSPAFLVFTPSATHNLPFQKTMSQTGILINSPTIFGELNYYGALLYPGLILLIYNSVKRKGKQYDILLWWIVCYLACSSIAYYDNPNPARNIIGLPALIITIALFIDFLLKVAPSCRGKNMWRFINSFKLVPLILFFLVAIPTGLFLHEYYFTYATESSKVFDYGYMEIADYLSANDLFEKDIYIHDKWGRDLTLSFYSPEQPPLSKILFISDVKRLDPKKSFIQISKEITFEHGIIEYEMQIHESCGDVASPHIFLIRTEDNALQLAIYANDSKYMPNGYLLWQKVNGTRYFEQKPLNEIIEYGKWYTVRLVVNSTFVSFYFDGTLITTWLRPADDTYLTLKLAGESATFSFSNLKIEKNNRYYDLFDKDSLSDWAIISGKMKIKQDIDGDIIVILLPKSSDALLVTRYQEDSIAFSGFLSSKLLKNIYYPDGSLAFSIFELMPRSRGSN